MNFYEVLGVPRDASPEEIKRAWTNWVKIVHPDHHENDSFATEICQKINEAYATLSDPDKRILYDYDLRTEESGRAYQPPPPPEPEPEYDDTPDNADASYSSIPEDDFTNWRTSTPPPPPRYTPSPPQSHSALSPTVRVMLAVGLITILLTPFLITANPPVRSETDTLIKLTFDQLAYPGESWPEYHQGVCEDLYAHLPFLDSPFIVITKINDEEVIQAFCPYYEPWISTYVKQREVSLIFSKTINSRFTIKIRPDVVVNEKREGRKVVITSIVGRYLLTIEDNRGRLKTALHINADGTLSAIPGKDRTSGYSFDGSTAHISVGRTDFAFKFQLTRTSTHSTTGWYLKDGLLSFSGPGHITIDLGMPDGTLTITTQSS